MITSYELGKIYEFSTDTYFINKTVGILISYGQEDEKYRFEFSPLLKEYQRETEFASYIREVSYTFRDNLFGVVTEH
jgi:hypothetical protein